MNENVDFIARCIAGTAQETARKAITDLGGIQFLKISKTDYDSIEHDPNTIYYVSDNNNISQYLGDILITGNNSFTGIGIPQLYGAVGDGITDDTIAFQTAFDNNNIVIVPNGTYLITSALEIKHKNFKLFGSGKLYGRITNGTNSIIVLDNDTYNGEIKNILISGLEFESDPMSNIMTSILLVSNVTMAEGYIKERVDNIIFDNLYIHDMTGNGIHFHGGNQLYNFVRPTVTIKNCVIDDSELVGICQSCVESVIDNCTVRNSGLENVTIDNGCVCCSVINSRFYNSNGGGGNISIDECDDVRIKNCFIYQESNTKDSDVCINFNAETGVCSNVQINDNFINGGIYGFRNKGISSGYYASSACITNNIFVNQSNNTINILYRMSWLTYDLNKCYSNNNIPTGTWVKSNTGNVKL